MLSITATNSKNLNVINSTSKTTITSTTTQVAVFTQGVIAKVENSIL